MYFEPDRLIELMKYCGDDRIRKSSDPSNMTIVRLANRHPCSIGRASGSARGELRPPSAGAIAFHRRVRPVVPRRRVGVDAKDVFSCTARVWLTVRAAVHVLCVSFCLRRGAGAAGPLAPLVGPGG